MELVFLQASWCTVCHAKAPVAAEVAREHGLPLRVLDVETESGAERAASLRVHTVPTLALVDGARVRFRLVGRMITPENVAHLVGLTRSPGGAA